jgi:hypothetical protein
MKAKMKVRVKYIYNSAALGGPEPMEISGTVFHIDDNGPAGGRLTLREDEEHYMVLSSTWVPTDEERERIANGENIELLVWGSGHPPVAMEITDVPLGKKPGSQTKFVDADD